MPDYSADGYQYFPESKTPLKMKSKECEFHVFQPRVPLKKKQKTKSESETGIQNSGPGSQVLILDYATFLTSLKKIEEFLYLRNKKVIHIKKRRKGFTLLSLFCLHLNSKNRKVTGNIIHNSKWSYITLQASCMSYIFVNINTNWTWR